MRITRRSKRSITASTSSIKAEFQKFAKSIESSLEDAHIAFSKYFGLDIDLTAVSDGPYESTMYITPVYQGIKLDDIYSLQVVYDKNDETPYSAYCNGTGNLIADGYSLSDIEHDCYIWLSEIIDDVDSGFIHPFDDDSDYYE